MHFYITLGEIAFVRTIELHKFLTAAHETSARELCIAIIRSTN
jgi:hypothetical protein